MIGRDVVGGGVAETRVDGDDVLGSDELRGRGTTGWEVTGALRYLGDCAGRGACGIGSELRNSGRGERQWRDPSIGNGFIIRALRNEEHHSHGHDEAE